jgi:hypothetical protein
MKAHPTMTRACRCIAAFVLATAFAGCAATGNGAVTTLTQQGAARTIVVGKSTRADIEAAFGRANVTRFANGYELWLYQVGYSKAVDSMPYVNLVVSSADNKRELSILFDKDGVVKKYLLMDQ